MFRFKSTLEKRYWIAAALCTATIFSTVFFENVFSTLIQDQNVAAAFFLACMFLGTLVVILSVFKWRPMGIELIIWIGILAIYAMFVLWLSMAERSHLIEYSVLAILILEALRQRVEYLQWKTYLKAFLITSSIGLLDECLQFFLPNRVFDLEDIVFNTFAAGSAVAVSGLLSLLRQRFTKTQS